MDLNHRVLEITLLSAKGLKKVNLLTKMEVYAVVSITGGNRTTNQKIKTSVDHDGDANPSWNFPMKFTIDEEELGMNPLMLNFELVCQRALGDKEVGKVQVSLKELSQAKGSADGKEFVSYQARKSNGQPKGQISFSYKFTGKSVSASPAPTLPPHAPAIPETTVPGKFEQQPFLGYLAGPSSIDPPPGMYPRLDAFVKPGEIGVYPPVPAYPPQPTGSGVYPPQDSYHGGPGQTGVYPPATPYPSQPAGVYPPPDPYGVPGKTELYPPATPYPSQPAGVYPPPDPYGVPGKAELYPPATPYPPQPAGVYPTPPYGSLLIRR